MLIAAIGGFKSWGSQMSLSAIAHSVKDALPSYPFKKEAQAIKKHEAEKAAEKMRDMVKKAREECGNAPLCKEAALTWIKDVKVGEDWLGRPRVEVIANRPTYPEVHLYKNFLGQFFAFDKDGHSLEIPLNQCGKIAGDQAQFEQAVEKQFFEYPPGPMAQFHTPYKIEYDDLLAGEEKGSLKRRAALDFIAGFTAATLLTGHPLVGVGAGGLLTLYDIYKKTESALASKLQHALEGNKKEAIGDPLPRCSLLRSSGQRSADLSSLMTSSKEEQHGLFSKV